MRPALIVSAGAVTHPGCLRSLNEDAHLATSPIFLVADGMGGHEAGERASAAAISSFAHLIGHNDVQIDQVSSALARARASIESLSHSARGRAGTTLSGAVLASVDGMGYWLVLNIGDSRTYRFADRELEQITVDHSVVQELIEAGELTEEQATHDRRRNIITRALGGGSEGEADYWLFPAELGDRMLVCSDGLPNELSAEHIRGVLDSESDPQKAAEILLDDAVRAGARDNVTVVVVDAVSVASRPGMLVASDDDIDADTLPRAASAGGVR